MRNCHLGEPVTTRLLIGDCRAILPTLDARSVHCCVTSPPYFGLRDYGVAGQIGLEPSPDAYIAELVAVFRKVRRVLRDDGTLWLNLGDSYASDTKGSGGPCVLPGAGKAMTDARYMAVRRISHGLKPKDLMLIPARVALALQADGWWLRSDIIWAKPNPMPESVTDRPTSAHEHVFLLSKRERYWYDATAVREPMAAASVDRLSQDIANQAGSLRANGGAKTNGPMRAVAKGNAKTFRGGVYTGSRAFDNDGQMERDSHGNEPNETGSRNLRNVWTIATQPFSEAHFATFPPELAERCIKAGCPKDGTVLDPFSGAGTTGLVADRLQRNAVLIELNPQYAAMTSSRIEKDAGMFAAIAP